MQVLWSVSALPLHHLSSSVAPVFQLLAAELCRSTLPDCETPFLPPKWPVLCRVGCVELYTLTLWNTLPRRRTSRRRRHWLLLGNVWRPISSFPISPVVFALCHFGHCNRSLYFLSFCIVNICIVRDYDAALYWVTVTCSLLWIWCKDFGPAIGASYETFWF